MRHQYSRLSVRRWTISAIECFKRGCVCVGCFYDEFFKNSHHKCRMKEAVLESVRRLGRPKGIQTKGILKNGKQTNRHGNMG